MPNYLEDINLLKKEFSYLNRDLNEIKKEFSSLNDKISELCFILNQKVINKSFKENQNKSISQIQIGPIEKRFSEKEIIDIKKYLSSAETTFKEERNLAIETPLKDFKTDFYKNKTGNLLFNPQKGENKGISIRNQGVPTDRQTDRQTDKSKENNSFLEDFSSINSAANLLDSLDSLKKEIRLKFKRLTDQEMSVFSTIYLLEEEIGYASYKLLAEKLNLTESSIRDYVRRLLIKGIPLIKEKINHKEITLNISQNLKKITSLSTLLRLREL